ncbi:MAG: asparagine synthase-related protein [Candidatus Diapherotrites archaeon]|nr:asparagine synthase-related protein [Candidatus Diapherotrites archaeon]
MSESDFFKNPENILALKKRVPGTHSTESLSSAFLSACKKDSVGIKKCAVLFSGGLDSSLVAFALKGVVPEIRLYCAGLEGSSALRRAEENAGLLGMELQKIQIKKEEIPALLEETEKAIGSGSLLQLQIALPAFAALREAKMDGFRTVFSGTGADELFCGYKEFCFALEKGGHAAVEALCWEKLEGMFERNLKRETALARHFSIKSKTPFLDEGFILQAMAFPAKEKISSPKDELRKNALREMARFLGLPEKICSEKKKAVQFDSGISREAEKILKKQRPGK